MFYILCIFLEVHENALDEDEESEIEDDDDEEKESEMPVSEPLITAKDGTKWAETQMQHIMKKIQEKNN